MAFAPERRPSERRSAMGVDDQQDTTQACKQVVPVREPTSEEKSALEELRARLVATVGFFELAEDYRSGPRLRGIIDSAARKGDLRSLRLLKREIDGMMSALLPDHRKQLDNMLNERFGASSALGRLEQRERAHKALKRGRVASEKERKRLEDYVEFLAATGGSEDEITAFTELLSSP